MWLVSSSDDLQTLILMSFHRDLLNLPIILHRRWCISNWQQPNLWTEMSGYEYLIECLFRVNQNNTTISYIARDTWIYRVNDLLLQWTTHPDVRGNKKDLNQKKPNLHCSLRTKWEIDFFERNYLSREINMAFAKLTAQSLIIPLKRWNMFVQKVCKVILLWMI